MALIWRGQKIQKALLTKARRDVLDCALLVEGMVKASMKRGGRTESGEAVLKAGTKLTMVEPGTGKKLAKVGTYASKEGEVPRVQTGTLKRSITHWLHPVLPISRAGTNVVYGKYLDFGAGYVAPRPFMRPALEKAKPAIKAIFGRQLATEGLR